MVANPSKFQLMFLSKYRNIEKNMSFAGKTIKSSDTVELLGITLDKNINFNIKYCGYLWNQKYRNGERNARNVGIFTRIPGNLLEDSGKCWRRFWGMLKKIPGNGPEDSWECSRRFRKMFKRTPGNVQEDSGKCPKKSGKCSRGFWGMSKKISGNAQEDFGKSKFRFIFYQILQLNCEKTKEYFLRYYLLRITNLLRLNTVFFCSFFYPLFFLLSKKGCNYCAQVQGYQKNSKKSSIKGFKKNATLSWNHQFETWKLNKCLCCI